MSKFVEYQAVAAASQTLPLWAEPIDPSSPDATLIAACLAARVAVQAFDEAARRGDSFDRLCELSQNEHRAVKAVAKTRAATARGIAEKALLLDAYLNGADRGDFTPETLDVVMSLAADSVALARTILSANRDPSSRQ